MDPLGDASGNALSLLAGVVLGVGSAAAVQAAPRLVTLIGAVTLIVNSEHHTTESTRVSQPRFLKMSQRFSVIRSELERTRIQRPFSSQRAMT